MEIKIEIYCPRCAGAKIVKNGIKSNNKQNYLCKSCNRQFVGDHNLTYQRCHSQIDNKIKLMLVRGNGIRDISIIENISIGKILSVSSKENKMIEPKEKCYDKIEVDEIWSFIGKKKNKYWGIYAYCQKTGEILAYVFEKRNIHTARRLKEKINSLNISYKKIATDNRESFKKVFGGTKHLIGKKHTGNNCRIRCWLRRYARRTCCFSKKESNHLKAFELLIYYINYGHV